MEVDSISQIKTDKIDIQIITGTDSAGETNEVAISTAFFKKIKGAEWCIEGSLARVVAEQRTAGKTTYQETEDSEPIAHTHSGLSANRLSKGSQSQWKTEMTDKTDARKQAAKADNVSIALKKLAAAVESGLSEEIAAKLIGTIMS